jgi:hypothetical protein
VHASGEFRPAAGAGESLDISAQQQSAGAKRLATEAFCLARGGQKRGLRASYVTDQRELVG